MRKSPICENIQRRATNEVETVTRSVIKYYCYADNKRGIAWSRVQQLGSTIWMSRRTKITVIR